MQTCNENNIVFVKTLGYFYSIINVSFEVEQLQDIGGSRGGQGVRTSPEKSQKYRIPYQY